MEKEPFKDRLKSFFARCGEDTPPFFKKLKKVGLIVAAAGTAVVTAPIALPAAVVTIGGYLIVGGAVATAISQAAINDTDCLQDEDGDNFGGFAPMAN